MVRKYLFADESGNFDFRDPARVPNGPSRYFSVGTIMVEGDEALGRLDADLLTLKRDLAWKNIVHDSAFHATEDPQEVRDQVFDTLGGHDFAVDVTLLEKSKAQPHICPPTMSRSTGTRGGSTCGPSSGGSAGSAGSVRETS